MAWWNHALHDSTRPGVGRVSGSISVAILLLAQFGCANQPASPAMPPPTTLFSTDYFPGTVLGGATTLPVSWAKSPSLLDAGIARMAQFTQSEQQADAALAAFDPGNPPPVVRQQLKDQIDHDPDVIHANQELAGINKSLTDLTARGATTQPQFSDLQKQQKMYSHFLEDRTTQITSQQMQSYARLKDSLVQEKARAHAELIATDAELAADLGSLQSDLVHVTFLALENVPTTNFSPAGSRAVFFSSSNGGSAVLPAAQLTRGVSISDLKDSIDLPATLRAGHAGRITPMATLTGALPAGITARFSTMDPTVMHDPLTGDATRRSVAVLVTRRSDPALPLQIALVLKDLRPRREGGITLQSETAIFDLPSGNQSNTALIIPFHFDDAVSQCIAALVQITPGPGDPSQAVVVSQCLKQIAAVSSTTQPAITTGEANAWATVTAAVQSLNPVKGRRSALAFLSGQTGATLCEDLALEADDNTLAQLVQKIQAKVAVNEPAEDDLTVGWLLDHTALQQLAAIAADAANGNKVPPELLAILTTHTGEVGRHPSSLDDVLKGVASRAELDKRLLAENMIFLEDSSPASRVRAFDWLTARHLAPAGYDPLASGKARREALEKAAGQ